MNVQFACTSIKLRFSASMHLFTIHSYELYIGVDGGHPATWFWRRPCD